MVSIVHHIPEQTVFEPGTITAMSRAFEETCIALHVFAGDQRGRELIATRIIDLARNGVIDAAALRDTIVSEARLSA